MRAHIFSLSSVLTVLFVIAFLTPSTTSAQIAASELSTLTQKIDGTVVSIVYSRPSRRGRDVLFGGVMAYGDIITPGANMATTIEFSKDVKIDGKPVPAGKYSVWIAFEPGQWEFLLDETAERFHGPHPARAELEYGFPVTPKEIAAEKETMTFEFPTVRPDGAILRLHWGTTMIELNIEVQPTPFVNITASDAARYVGSYSVDVVKLPPFTMFDGTVEIDMTYENGFLHSIMNIGPYTDPHDLAFYPLPQADQVYFPVMLINGVPAESFQGGVLMEFTTDNSGKATGFQARMADDTVWLTGTKID